MSFIRSLGSEKIQGEVMLFVDLDEDRGYVRVAGIQVQSDLGRLVLR